MVTVLKQVVGLLALLFTFTMPTYAQSDNAYQEAYTVEKFTACMAILKLSMAF